MNDFLEAIRAGWIIASVASVLARGKTDEGRGFLVTLLEPNKHMLRKVYLPYSERAQKLLSSKPYK
ncbi:MAG: hypothetical protein Kow002_20900 [Anaerolineales bacterium]